MNIGFATALFVAGATVGLFIAGLMWAARGNDDQ